MNETTSEKKEKLYPLLLSNIVFVKDRDIKGIYIIAKNVPGALAEITSLFARYNLNIISINFTPSVRKEEDIPLFFTIDFTNSTMKLENIVSKLKSLEKVSDAWAVKPYIRGSLLVDEIHFPIIDNTGSRLLILCEENMKLFVVGMRERFGNVGLTLLYFQGEITGKILAERYMDLGLKNLEDGLTFLLLNSFSLGRYRGEIIEFSIERRRIIIRLYDSWECVTAKKYGIEGPASHFERGIFAGFIKRYLNTEVTVIETKCLASGDPYCEFDVTIE